MTTKKKTMKRQPVIPAVILYSPFLPDVTSSYEAREGGKHKKQMCLTGRPMFTLWKSLRYDADEKGET